MHRNCHYLGKSVLKDGHFLSIPSNLRETFKIDAGDSLEMHAEGNAIIIKPVRKPANETSGSQEVHLHPSSREKGQSRGKGKPYLRLVESK